jgi:hypothetical protein
VQLLLTWNALHRRAQLHLGHKLLHVLLLLAESRARKRLLLLRQMRATESGVHLSILWGSRSHLLLVRSLGVLRISIVATIETRSVLCGHSRILTLKRHLLWYVHTLESLTLRVAILLLWCRSVVGQHTSHLAHVEILFRVSSRHSLLAVISIIMCILLGLGACLQSSRSASWWCKLV